MQESDDWEGRPPFANRMKGMTASEIRELLKILDQPDVISFAGGIPDPALFPVSEIDRFSRRILGAADTARSALQYSVSEGFVPLRQWLALHMASLGVPCDVENIAITSGSQQALDFVGRLLLNPGDTALLMAPTYLGAFQAFSAFEPRYDRLDLSEGGPSGQFYAATARAAGGRAALAYVVPDFANPTGETLSEAQRLRLLDLAAEANNHASRTRHIRLCASKVMRYPRASRSIFANAGTSIDRASSIAARSPRRLHPGCGPGGCVRHVR